MEVCTGALANEVKALKLTISRLKILLIPIHGLRPCFMMVYHNFGTHIAAYTKYFKMASSHLKKTFIF